MELFNIGALEFVFIFLLAFIILGPKKVVEHAGVVGKWVRDLMKSPLWKEIVTTTKDIKDIPRKIMDDAEIQSTIDEIDRSAAGVYQHPEGSSPIEEDLRKRFMPDEQGENRIYPGDSPDEKE